ncbi:MAG: glycine betaine ABC transporter substrate-binding protein [Paracoccaceae bacterium]|nr:glycine betaine ABC transporter substrate-binding protein [Paracoccaceae bacterium]MDG1370972.1 glycine betaine ABC transporter substrate-binding protein [Paracoccaceae bacterium]
MKTTFALVGAALGLAVAAPASAGGLLKAPVADWTGGAVTCEIIHQILENEMDYKVKRITMPSGPGVAEGLRGGDLDFACETWPSYSTTKEKYVTEYGGDGSVKYFAPVGVIGQSGYFVPRYMIEGDGAVAPDLKTHADLNKYKGLFKTLESGDKGRLIGCPVAAWECKDAERIAGLNLDYQLVELGSETAHWAEMKAAYARKEPFLAYAWTPHWIFAELDLVEIGLPPHSEEAWPVSDWPEDVTYNYGRPDLSDDHPQVVQLIENFRLSNDEQAGLILAIDIEGKDIEDVASAWLADNKSTWTNWVPQTN